MNTQCKQDNAVKHSYKFGQRVSTPFGEGEIVTQIIEEDSWLVCYERKEFTPAKWKSLCPTNGPCTYRMVMARDIEPK